jgi:hypothetical protein
MTPKQTINFLVSRISHPRVPICLRGAPGIGKTAWCQQVADMLDKNFVVIRGAFKNGTDFYAPWPNQKDKCLDFYVASWIKQMKPNTILLLDEIGTLPPDVEKALFSIINERQIGEEPNVAYLPDDCFIICTCNRATDRAGSRRLTTALANRMCFIDAETCTTDVVDYFTRCKRDQRVIDFLRTTEAEGKPAVIRFDPSSDEDGFPSPRSWEATSDMLIDTPADSVWEGVRGLIGQSTAGQFKAHCECYMTLPKVEDVVADPAKRHAAGGIRGTVRPAGAARGLPEGPRNRQGRPRAVEVHPAHAGRDGHGWGEGHLRRGARRHGHRRIRPLVQGEQKDHTS